MSTVQESGREAVGRGEFAALGKQLIRQARNHQDELVIWRCNLARGLELLWWDCVFSPGFIDSSGNWGKGVRHLEAGCWGMVIKPEGPVYFSRENFLGLPRMQPRQRALLKVLRQDGPLSRDALAKVLERRSKSVVEDLIELSHFEPPLVVYMEGEDEWAAVG